MKPYKYLLLIIVLLLQSVNIFSQTDYYSGTDGINGAALKSILHNKIKNHKQYSYDQVWDLLKETDKDPNNAANVILIYTDVSVNAAQEYNGGNGWNREHVWAKSHGFPNKSDTGYTDVHHLRPSNIRTNSTRGSKDFDYGGNNTTAKDVHYDSDSWEPRDEIKGDIARMMLYMTVRYEGGDGYDLELVEYTGTSGAKFGKKSVLLEWNRLDPVSEFERNRNRVIHKYQKNFNPFVDHPEFADRIYNSDKLFLENAQPVSGNTLLLSFSKELNSTEAENITNYQLDFLGTPSKATANFGGDAKKVTLVFSENFIDTFYNIRVSNISSTSGETIFENSIALFLADETTEVDTTAPSKPINFVADTDGQNITLNWDANPESDLSHYAIYRGVVQNFTPSQYTLLSTVTTNSYIDEEIFDYKIYYRVSAFDKNGNESEYSDETSILVGIDDESKTPLKFSLSQNYPNPFNPSTTIKYSISNDIPHNLLPLVTLKIYNILGKEVATLVNETKTAGNYEVTFYASNLTSGIYFYRISVGEFRKTKSMLLIK